MDLRPQAGTRRTARRACHSLELSVSMTNDFAIERAAGNAMMHAMSRFTFGIVGDANGLEGRGLGTGVGLVWEGKNLILTAAHTLETTPYERMYFFLPVAELQVTDSAASVSWSEVGFQVRQQLEKPQVLLGEDDLAAILVPDQPKETTERHFYSLDEDHFTPGTGTEVGYLGYPGARSQQVGKNYSASLFGDFGDICEASRGLSQSEFFVPYRPGSDPDPHGLSGSGVWHSRSAGKIWVPQIALAGLVTKYDAENQLLVCYRVETIVEFLKSHAAWFSR